MSFVQRFKMGQMADYYIHVQYIIKPKQSKVSIKVRTNLIYHQDGIQRYNPVYNLLPT